MRLAGLCTSIAIHALAAMPLLPAQRFRAECPPVAQPSPQREKARAARRWKPHSERQFRPPFDFPHHASLLAYRIGYAHPVRVEYEVRDGEIASVRIVGRRPPKAIARELIAWVSEHDAPPDGLAGATVFHFERQTPAGAIGSDVERRSFFFRGVGRFDRTRHELPRCRLVPVEEGSPMEDPAGGAGAGREF